jgi:hypothetical protein
MHHPFRNCPAYFGQPENSDQCVLSGYTGSYVCFVRGFNSVIPLLSYTPKDLYQSKKTVPGLRMNYEKIDAYKKLHIVLEEAQE